MIFGNSINSDQLQSYIFTPDTGNVRKTGELKTASGFGNQGVKFWNQYYIIGTGLRVHYFTRTEDGDIKWDLVQ